MPARGEDAPRIVHQRRRDAAVPQLAVDVKDHDHRNDLAGERILEGRGETHAVNALHALRDDEDRRRVREVPLEQAA